ncbi:hypothetical protein Rhopal_007529-T1 [Rhodotorula paludigena]|uniref:Uncharacterized protein n=1 Tax=Rhodotorula paludigena TaxID=86838 RepID=A0AAV5GV89_9BASI|nr:hypothetical protein Rhopal_007529-T1 [Rhodotorula paludigena]
MHFAVILPSLVFTATYILANPVPAAAEGLSPAERVSLRDAQRSASSAVAAAAAATSTTRRLSPAERVSLRDAARSASAASAAAATSLTTPTSTLRMERLPWTSRTVLAEATATVVSTARPATFPYKIRGDIYASTDSIYLGQNAFLRTIETTPDRGAGFTLCNYSSDVFTNYPDVVGPSGVALPPYNQLARWHTYISESLIEDSGLSLKDFCNRTVHILNTDNGYSADHLIFGSCPKRICPDGLATARTILKAQLGNPTVDANRRAASGFFTIQ